MEELILKEREFKENLVKVINESQLPAFIIKPVIKEILEQVNMVEQQQYENAVKQIENNKKEKNKNS